MEFKDVLDELDKTFTGDLEFKVALTEAVEKQIPKKCKLFKDACGCGHMVFPHMDYCDKCGQALDWGKEDAGE